MGQLTNSTAITQGTAQDETALASWLSGKAAQQITRTFYDNSYINGGGDLCPEYLCQQNLRNRVSYTAVYASGTPGSFDNHAAATYYSYDIHGNVDTLLQDYAAGVMNDAGNRFKKMVYDYDLVSGKVNAVNYQPGQDDAFYHRYAYDAENRITGVETSSDKIYWEQEAAYEYYRHGPLARTVLGQNRVQGVDYAYTLHGWLKGINSSTVATGYYDIGTDGKTGSVNSNVARDAYGFALHYYQDDAQLHYDYKAIGTGKKPFANPGLIGSTAYTELYNGNIGAISMNIPKAGIPLLSIYKYDQLNRLKNSFNYTGLNSGTNSWTRSATQDYREVITYDPNGNIKTYKRNGSIAGGGQQLMDNMTYEYIANSNKLKRVTDNVPAAYYTEDIDNQTDANNYAYDAIGNLIQDKAEGIDSIRWNVYGKISRIVKNKAGVSTTINYTYDASGNRISKDVNGDKTFYVRDASGNVMSVYEMEDTLKQKEIHLYGSSRLGIFNVDKDVQSCALPGAEITIFTRGNKFFELTNHLGNVLVTISDRKLQHSTNGTTVDYYMADVITANDYYPGGMQMPGRNFQSDSYRYGFNGKENDNEVKGEGNQQDYGMRIYDTRLGRFLSVDPLTKTFPYYSPYHYASNSPIKFKDLDGGEPLDYLQNWVYQSLFEMKTSTLVGDGTYMQVWVQSQPELGMINVEMIYDKWTEKCWFIHSDDQGNYYYLKNKNGESGVMSIVSGENKNFVKGGEFLKFETQNAKQARLTGELVDAMASSLALAAAAITGLEAGIGIRALFGIYKMSKSEEIQSPGNSNNSYSGYTKDQLNSSKKNYEELIKEHKQKIEEFKKDPIGNSDKKWLEQASKDNPSKETLLERAKGRIPALKKQLKKQEGELEKINEVLKTIE